MSTRLFPARIALLLALPGALLWALPALAEPAATDPVLPPACAARPRSFGCANGANIAVMAAPADLVRGRALSAADGALEANAVGRLRADKVKDLSREGATDRAGGGAPR